MITLVVGGLLALLTLLGISLQKTYSHIPFKELKRRARGGDDFANLLYKAVSQGISLRLFLWLIIGLSSAGFIVVLTRIVPDWLAWLGGIILLWVGFVWLPNSRVTFMGRRVARVLTPPIAWLLNYIAPVLNFIGEKLHRFRHLQVHTGLYQKEDLLALINQQLEQEDNRISKDELKIAAGALTFGDKLIRNIMTPRRMVNFVSTTDSVGPILMNELHDSGHSRFPVYQDTQENIIGTLYLHDLLTAQEGGRVRDIMKKDVYYVHEGQSLDKALQAFLKTKHHLFIVVNSFEEMVGIVTIEDILEQIIGRPIIDEFDKYDDMRAVAQISADKDHRDRTEK